MIGVRPQPSRSGSDPDLFDLYDHLDLDRDAHRQRAHADRGARVLSLVAKHLHEEIGAAVDHLRMVLELSRRVDHAELLPHDCEQIESYGARVLVRLLDRIVATDLALRAPAVLAGARALAGEVE